MCAEIKPQFYKKRDDVLIKATKPMKQLSIDFKGPLKISTRNKYFLVAIDKYSWFSFAFPCLNMETSNVIKSLDLLFTLCGTADYAHSDWEPSLMSEEQCTYLSCWTIASSHSAAYNPCGNGEVERYAQTVWKSMLLSLKMYNLPTSEWEQVMPKALNLIRSLINTTNGIPHQCFFGFSKRSMCGTSTPTWLKPGKSVFVCKFNRQSKTDPLVEKMRLIHTNPSYAFIKYNDGRESSVLLRDLAPCPESTEPEVESSNSIDVIHRELSSDPSIEEVTAPQLKQPSSTVELSEPSLVPPPSDQRTSTVVPVEPSQSMPYTKAPPKSHPVRLR